MFTLVIIVTFILCVAFLSGGMSTVGGRKADKAPKVDKIVETAEPTAVDEDYVDPEDVPSKGNDDVDEDNDSETSNDSDEDAVRDNTDGMASPDIVENNSRDNVGSESLENGNSKKQNFDNVKINEELGLPEVTINPDAID